MTFSLEHERQCPAFAFAHDYYHSAFARLIFCKAAITAVFFVIGWFNMATKISIIRLFRLLSRTHGDDAFGRYNALLRRLVSFTRALDAAATRRKKTAP